MKHVKKSLGYAMVMIVAFTMGVSASRFGHMDAAYSSLETAEREIDRSFANLPGKNHFLKRVFWARARNGVNLTYVFFYKG